MLAGTRLQRGGLVYGLKCPDPVTGVFGFHELWHLFVLAGCALPLLGGVALRCAHSIETRFRAGRFE